MKTSGASTRAGRRAPPAEISMSRPTVSGIAAAFRGASSAVEAAWSTTCSSKATSCR